MTDTRDAELRRALAVVCDTDRGEDPLAWSELPPPPRISRDAIDQALRWSTLRARAAAGDVLARVQLAAHDVGAFLREVR